MTVKGAFTSQGILLGKATENMDGSWSFEDPVIAMPQGTQNIAFLPLLGLMEEKTITLKAEDFAYGQMFTPSIDIRNHYNKMFGAGIIEVGSNALQM